MSVRANGLRILVVDSLFYTGIMTLAAASWTAVANGAEPRVVHVADIATENRSSSDHIDSRLNTDDNLPSGNPEESPAAKREAMMLGMKLFERAPGKIEVLDVAAETPAWDAGIRRGDRIREIDGVAPRSLADWVQDVGKVLDERKDGKLISAEVERDGEPLAVSIKLPVSNADQARDARKEDEAIAKAQVREQRQLRQGQPAGGAIGYGGEDRNDYGPGPGYGGGYGGGSGGWGMGGFFDDGSAAANNPNSGDRMATSAVAPLMAVNTANPNGTQTSGGQIGMAGFQNNQQGVDAMVVVRGLPQGTYQVGIGAGGNNAGDGNADFVGPDVGADGQFGLNPALEGTAENAGRGAINPNQRGFNNNQPGANGNQVNPQNPAGNQFPNQQQPGFVPGGQTPGVPQGNVPGTGAGATPGAGGAGGGAAPAGDGASLANPQNAILAQQLDPQQQQAISGEAMNAQRNLQPGAQNNAAVQRNNNNSAQGANPYDPRDRAEAQRQMQQGNNPLGNLGGGGPFAQIGTIQVGADGSGQVQGRLEGMNVRNLAGMQVIVQSTNWQGGGGAPTDPRLANNRNAQNQNIQNQNVQNQNVQNQAAQGQARPGQGVLPGQQQGFGANGQMQGRGAQGIVAAGTIQLRNGNGAGVNPQSGTGQGAVDEATRREQGRSQISDPTQDFNPSSPVR